jgi:peptidoglycan-associated lipoprotein
MTGTGQPNVDLESLLWGPSGLEIIHFDFDSYSLRPDARAALQRNADKIKQAPGAMIQIEGHCDERGTQEYNLALGEKRALATREYLIQLGVPSSQLVTISYGEEDPLNPASNEAAWAQNRRCEFNKARR